MYYGVDAGPEWGLLQQLAVERTKNLVEVHTHISCVHAEGHRSTQGVIALYAGAPIMWSTTRQPFAVSEYSRGGVGRTLWRSRQRRSAALVTELGLGKAIHKETKCSKTMRLWME